MGSLCFSQQRRRVLAPHRRRTRSFGNPAQEEDRVVIIRFGHDHDETCMQMDEARCTLGAAAAAAAMRRASAGRRARKSTPRPAGRRSWPARQSA